MKNLDLNFISIIIVHHHLLMVILDIIHLLGYLKKRHLYLNLNQMMFVPKCLALHHQFQRTHHHLPLLHLTIAIGLFMVPMLLFWLMPFIWIVYPFYCFKNLFYFSCFFFMKVHNCFHHVSLILIHL